MSKKIIISLSVLFTSISLFILSCEKDDICISSAPSTPELVLQFFDKNTPEKPKNISSIYVKADGQTDGLVFTEVDRVNIPLQTNQSQTNYTFYSNFNPADGSYDNEDRLTVNYTPIDSYISRACGYRTLFALNQNDGVVIEPDSDNWLSNPEIINHSVILSDSTHVKVFH